MQTKFAFIALAAVALVAAGCNKTTPVTAPDPAPQAQTDPAPAPMMKKMSQVTMTAQNGSKQTGTATFTGTADNKTEVVIEIAGGAKGVAQPAHIHVGSCAAPGAVKFPLTNVVDGKSTTVLDTPFMDIWNQLPLALNVHKSAAEVSVYVSCGDLPA